jgi:uncharacterized protein DUF6941
MPSVPPLVRDFVLCEDMIIDPANPTKISLVNLIYSIYSSEDPPFPLRRERFCVFAALTNGHGLGRIELEVIEVETQDVVYRLDLGDFVFGNEPLRVYGVPIRIRSCVFPKPGWYSVQLLCDGATIAEKQLVLR